MVCRSDENMRFYIFLHFLTVFLIFLFLCSQQERRCLHDCTDWLFSCCNWSAVSYASLCFYWQIFFRKHLYVCVGVFVENDTPRSRIPEMVCNLRLGAIWEGRGWNVIRAHSLTQFQPSFCNRAAYWIFLQACWCVIFCEWESECGQHRQRPQHVKFIMSSSTQWTSGQLDILAQVPSNASFLRSDSTEPQTNTVALIRSFVLLYSGH